MKCISLWQPWASLMALGKKRIETRSWPTGHRGLLAIHAAKKWNRDLATLCDTPPFVSALSPLYFMKSWSRPWQDLLPFGSIVAVVHLIDCQRVERIAHNERAFGDFTAGRFGWITSRVWQMPSPIPYRGAQGLFEVPDDLIYAALPERELAGAES